MKENLKFITRILFGVLLAAITGITLGVLTNPVKLIQWHTNKLPPPVEGKILVISYPETDKYIAHPFCYFYRNQYEAPFKMYKLWVNYSPDIWHFVKGNAPCCNEGATVFTPTNLYPVSKLDSIIADSANTKHPIKWTLIEVP